MNQAKKKAHQVSLKQGENGQANQRSRTRERVSYKDFYPKTIIKGLEMDQDDYWAPSMKNYTLPRNTLPSYLTMGLGPS